MAGIEVTEGSLLDGRVRYAQPQGGFRSGIEPVLLAAAVPARSGERVLEMGCGAGAALLCLSARVPGVGGLGVDIDAGMVLLARRNAAANGWPGLEFLTADAASVEGMGTFDHACANPPFHPSGGTASADASRDLAKRDRPGLLAGWVGAMAAQVRHRGTLTVILAAAELPRAIAALMAAGCPPSRLFPLWPREAQAAKLVIVQSVKAGRGPMRLSPGMRLHAADGSFTAEAQAVLREGCGIEL
ncbi:MAG TPA: methyltransferase [Acetobacteraceae bacterium]